MTIRESFSFDFVPPDKLDANIDAIYPWVNHFMNPDELGQFLITRNLLNQAELLSDFFNALIDRGESSNPVKSIDELDAILNEFTS